MGICALFEKQSAGSHPIPPLKREARHCPSEAQRITLALYLSFKQPIYKTNGEVGCNVVRGEQELMEYRAEHPA